MIPGFSQKLGGVIDRINALLDRLDQRVPASTRAPDWSARAFRWRGRDAPEPLQAIRRTSGQRLADLLGIDAQKAALDRNTRQFLAGLPANNALLWGSRGTGKSSLVKALLSEYAAQGLRVIEVDPRHLLELPDILDGLENRAEKFLIYCDDLSFAADDSDYKALKAVLDGSIGVTPDNVLIYATSNRRHLMPEAKSDNLDTHRVDDEIHAGEAIEEKISLSERFGLWLSFYPFSQDTYLAIVRHWLERLGSTTDEIDAARGDALRYALQRGSRSGRVAWQFAKGWHGSQRLTQDR